MRPLSATTGAASALLLLTLLSASPSPTSALQHILIYTGVGPDGFRHDSIPFARRALKEWGEVNEAFEATLTDDPAAFEERDWLMQFDALVFISTAGTALRPKGVEEFHRYIQAGGGFMGVHEATDCLYQVPWYRTLIGTTFNYHPQRQRFTMDVHHGHDHPHPSVSHLAERWTVTDEIYNFNSDPREVGNTVVLSADESTYVDLVESAEERAREQGDPHPISWYREGNLLTGDDAARHGKARRTHRRHHHRHGRAHSRPDAKLAHRKEPSSGIGNGEEEDDDDDDGHPPTASFKDSTGPGRSFYTGLGHDDNMWRDEDFLRHVGYAINWLLASTTISSVTNSTDLPGSPYMGDDAVASLGSGLGAGANVGASFGAGAGRNGSGPSSSAATGQANTGGAGRTATTSAPPLLLFEAAMTTALGLALGLLASNAALV
ncbi:hypothetical protein V8E36_000969 [Tilletia maclaganii]